MFPDIGFWEFVVVVVVTILVVGPKDLPKVMRTMGQFVSKARRMASEFQQNFEKMAEEAGQETGINDLHREFKAIESDSRSVLNETHRIDPSPAQPDLPEESDDDIPPDNPSNESPTDSQEKV